ITYKYYGKYRKYGKIKEPTLKDIIEFKRDLEREERNMLLLRHPYLTIEQTHGHMKEQKVQKYLDKVNKWREETNEKFNKKVTIMDRLNHLTVAEAWD
ncbi:hypothetical protein WN48_06156, partial [Eufriesea mexicana]